MDKLTVQKSKIANEDFVLQSSNAKNKIKYRQTKKPKKKKKKWRRRKNPECQMCSFQNKMNPSLKTEERPFQPSALCLNLAASWVWFYRSSSILGSSLSSWLMLFFWENNLWRWAWCDIIPTSKSQRSCFICWYFNILSEHVLSSLLYWSRVSINFFCFSIRLKVSWFFWTEICRLCTRSSSWLR